MKITRSTWKRIPILNLVLLTVFIVLIIIASIIGIDSDRGVLVAWLGVIILLAGITRRWRKEWQYLLLIAGAIIGSIILSALHDVIVGSDSIPQNFWLNFFHALITDTILFFTPVAIIYGIIGSITLLIIRLVTLRRKKLSEKA
ncbi:MAG: hypothetical protein ABR954_08905 [Dehalococcoidales bacterium]